MPTYHTTVLNTTTYWGTVAVRGIIKSCKLSGFVLPVLPVLSILSTILERDVLSARGR